MTTVTLSKSGIANQDPTRMSFTPNVNSQDWKLVEAAIDSMELSELHELRQLVLLAGLESHPGCCGAHDARRAPTLLRFLRARNHSPTDAFDLLAEAVVWRHEFQLDKKLAAWREEWTVGTSPRALVLSEYNFITKLGVDREGLPVYLSRFAQADPAGIVREIGQELFLIHSLMILEDNFEKSWQLMLKTGKVQFSFIEVYDVGNYGLVPKWFSRALSMVPVYKGLANILDRCYPERVRIIFMLRAPSAFAHFWRLVLPLVPINTRDKIRIRGSWSQKLLSELQQHVPPETIPKWFQTEDIEALRTVRPWGGVVPVGALQTMRSRTVVQL